MDFSFKKEIKGSTLQIYWSVVHDKLYFYDFIINDDGDTYKNVTIYSFNKFQPPSLVIEWYSKYKQETYNGAHDIKRYFNKEVDAK